MYSLSPFTATINRAVCLSIFTFFYLFTKHLVILIHNMMKAHHILASLLVQFLSCSLPEV